MSWRIVQLGFAITQRKEFITIDDSKEYKRCRVQVNRKGVVLRDTIKGISINTKKQQLCKEGDFLVAEIDAKVGGYGFVPEDLEDAIVSSHYFLFEVDETKMLKDYLAWLIKTDIIQEQINSKGSTNYAAIRPKNVLEFEIPLPTTIEEQQEVIDKLNSIYLKHSSIEKELNQQQSYLQLLRQTILQEAVQGKLIKQDAADEPASELLKRIKAEKQKLIKEGKLKKEKELPPIAEDEIPFELPKGWVWCRLGEIVLKLTDGTHNSPPNVAKGDFMYVTAKNIKDDGVLLDNISYVTKAVHDEIYARCNPEHGDILYIKDGATTGIVTINNVHEPFSMLSSVALIKLPKDIFNKYLLFVLRSPYYYQATRNDMAGIAITRVTLSKMITTLIPLPPLPEQQRIVTKVQQLQQHLNALETRVQQSREYAQQLLQAVLREAFETKGKVYEMEEDVSMDN